ncbi:MAG: 4Fe-4S binding protein [Lachnospiraceae bacterium]|nr:4Fe-4S binding protein [Lachnospiraceae bacterium]
MSRKKQIALIRCAGSAAIRTGGDPEERNGNCAALKETAADGAAVCIYGCLGGGSCVKICPKQAISFTGNGPAKADRKVCIGCGKCVKACPQNLITLVPAENTIQPLCSSLSSAKETRLVCSEGCIGCGICERLCPAGAIRVTGSHAVIDQKRCIACGMCAAGCPRNVIHDANGILAAE